MTLDRRFRPRLPSARAGTRFWQMWAWLALALVAAPPALAAQTVGRGDRVHTLTDTLVGAVGGVSVDGIGTIYVADFRETVWKVTPDGRASVFATGLYGASGNAVDRYGDLYQSNFSGNYITRIDRQGRQEIHADSGLSGPVGIAVGDEGELYVCNCLANNLSRVRPDGSVSTFAESDLFNCPNGITRDSDGNLYVVNFSDARMLAVSADGHVREFASLPGGGNGHVTFAAAGLYATSFRGHRVYRISLDGEVEHLAGTGALGETDGPAREATFRWPNGIAAGPQGDRLYVNDFINRFPPTVEVPPRPLWTLRQIKLASISDRMLSALESGGIEAMIEAHREWRRDPATAGSFTEVEVNRLGYTLMARGRLDAAIEAFKLNVDAYPSSFNVYDSLAEAYMNAGRNELAIEYYEKSLELNPANTNAVQKLERLREGEGKG